MKQRYLDTHINVLGWLFLISNSLFLFLGLAGFILMTGIGVATNDPVAMPILATIGVVAAMFFAVLALPGLLAGYGLLSRKSWARFLALVLAILNLLNFPLGTAIGIYTIWALAPEDSAGYFILHKSEK